MKKIIAGIMFLNLLTAFAHADCPQCSCPTDQLVIPKTEVSEFKVKSECVSLWPSEVSQDYYIKTFAVFTDKNGSEKKVQLSLFVATPGAQNLGCEEIARRLDEAITQNSYTPLKDYKASGLRTLMDEKKAICAVLGNSCIPSVQFEPYDKVSDGTSSYILYGFKP